MTNGGGIQTSASGRWGDYSMTTIDPADNVSFWHTDQYYATTGIIWSTKVGKVQFPAQNADAETAPDAAAAPVALARIP